MSNYVFTQFQQNERQTKSRGYGRPKTRSPFPTTSTGLKPNMPIICFGKSALQNFGLIVKRNAAISVKTANSAKKPAEVNKTTVTNLYGQRLKLSQPLQQINFISITKDERRDENNMGKITKADSLDVESSYNLTFYNPESAQKSKCEAAENYKNTKKQDYQLFIRRHLRKGSKISELIHTTKERPQALYFYKFSKIKKNNRTSE